MKRIPFRGHKKNKKSSGGRSDINVNHYDRIATVYFTGGDIDAKDRMDRGSVMQVVSLYDNYLGIHDYYM